MTKEHEIELAKYLADLIDHVHRCYPASVRDDIQDYLSQHPVMQEGKEEKVGFPVTDEIE